MRIIHFLNHTHVYNGHVNVAVDLACGQARLGHSVALACGEGDFDELLASFQVERICIEQQRRPGKMLGAVGRLRWMIRDFKPDIIHAHMMTSAVLAFFLRPFSRYKLVTTVHNEFEKSAILMGLGDRVVGVSQAVADNMQRRGVPKSRLRVILNGPLESPRLSSAPPEPKELRHPAILYVGGLHHRKGVDDLINAFKLIAPNIPNANLYLVGGGPKECETEYRRLAAESGAAERIEFCGAQRDPRGYMRGADLFVLASHSEPAGLVLVEARAAGCAVMGTSVGGIPEMLEGGKAGLLVPAKNPEMLAKAMEDVLGNEKVLRDLKHRAQMNLDYYTVDRVSRDYLSLYEEVMR